MKITIDISTVKKAMEAMLYFPGDMSDEMFESIRALRAALAQPQEPDPWGAGYEAGYAAGMEECPAQPVQEPKPLSYADALRIATEAVGRLKAAGPVEGLVGLVRAVEQAHGIK